jgi:hypothetical protein
MVTQSAILDSQSFPNSRMPIADSQACLWHRGKPLPLLPSGSDGVYGAALHRTQLSAMDTQHNRHDGSVSRVMPLTGR